MELVSVIVPIYKVEEYVRGCIESICAQTYRNLEIILVDDGSPDGCGAICDRYAEMDDRIHVVHKKNGGLGAARNTGALHATGKYILFVDGDDRICEELVRWTVKAAEENAADVVMFDFQEEDAGGNKGERFTFHLPPDHVISAEQEPRLIMESCSAWNKLFLRAFWEQRGFAFPQGRIYEDLGTIPTVMVRAERVVYIKKPLYRYLQREGSIMHSKDFSRNYSDRTAAANSVLDFFKKNGLYEKYEKELEYLVFENLLFVPIREIVLHDWRNTYLEKFREYAYGRFPGIDSNPYVREMQGKKRLLWALARRKWYGGMCLLSYTRRLKEKIFGK